jgi:ribA/ribD-fused uncharacterized protein
MEIFIKTVNDDNGWLSCMSAYPITYNGERFRTIEALFHWLRFQGHPNIQKEILEQKSPLAAKMKARKNSSLLNRGELWDEAPDDIPRMKECLQLKLTQHPELQDKLIKTGSAVIIEDSTPHPRESARFWGMVYRDGIWVGKNILGKLWMELREELKKVTK